MVGGPKSNTAIEQTKNKNNFNFILAFAKVARFSVSVVQAPGLVDQIISRYFSTNMIVVPHFCMAGSLFLSGKFVVVVDGKLFGDL